MYPTDRDHLINTEEFLLTFCFCAQVMEKLLDWISTTLEKHIALQATKTAAGETDTALETRSLLSALPPHIMRRIDAHPGLELRREGLREMETGTFPFRVEGGEDDAEAMEGVESGKRGNDDDDQVPDLIADTGKFKRRKTVRWVEKYTY